jgi:predicted  nucleic acid-binding Zn-ribbon protein
VQDVAERSREKSSMLQGFGDAVHRAEALEDQVLKSRKHAAAIQSKLDAAFAKYHNDVQELQAKGDDLVRKNKTLCNKNKGTPLDLLGSCWRSRGSLTYCTFLSCRA